MEAQCHTLNQTLKTTNCLGSNQNIFYPVSIFVALFFIIMNIDLIE